MFYTNINVHKNEQEIIQISFFCEKYDRKHSVIIHKYIYLCKTFIKYLVKRDFYVYAGNMVLLQN